MSDLLTPSANQQTETEPQKRKKGGQPGNQNGLARVGGKRTNQKRGAPQGNINARTHGFYARRLPAIQLEGLEDTTVRSLEDEIGVMRIFSRKVAELGSNVNQLDEAKSVLNTLANATSSINRLVRTHTRIPDPTLDPAWMLRHALEEEWPELKKFGDQFRTPEEIAALDAKIAAKSAVQQENDQPVPES